MAQAQPSPVGRFIHRLSVTHLVAAAPDDELVERFAVHREEAAFAALVRRHGPLVLGVCRRMLTDPHTAEDCFQETFLVLARKASSLKRPEALGPWLYGVATRTALQARAWAARRLECERCASVAEAITPSDGLVWRDLRPKLDAAIAGLPEKYRAPFILHHLEGLSVSEVAHRLGCPQGTTTARLARAKEQLRVRLAKQGLAPCAGALATALAHGAASAAVPPSLAAATVQAAMLIAAGKAVGALSALAAALTAGGLQVMSVSKVKVALAVLFTVSALGVGVGVSQHAGPGGEHPGADRVSTPGARQANGRQPPRGAALAFERYYAGGFRSLRGFEFRGVPEKAGSAEKGWKEPGASDRGSKDMRVDVQEQPTGSLMVGVGVNSNAGLVGSIVINEKNFDWSRPPTNLADLFESRAFRGAGQEFRIEAVPGTQLQRYTVSWREPSLFDRPCSPGVNSDDGLVGSMALNEKTFDILRPPLNSPECRIPIVADAPVYLMAFLDAGTVERTASLSDYRVAAGAGLRITVPMLGPVPIALDFPFPPVKRPEAPEQLFNFWIGFFS